MSIVEVSTEKGIFLSEKFATGSKFDKMTVIAKWTPPSLCVHFMNTSVSTKKAIEFCWRAVVTWLSFNWFRMTNSPSSCKCNEEFIKSKHKPPHFSSAFLEVCIAGMGIANILALKANISPQVFWAFWWFPPFSNKHVSKMQVRNKCRNLYLNAAIYFTNAIRYWQILDLDWSTAPFC